MIDFIFALVLLVLVVAAVELRKSYHAIPKKELRYRAAKGDPLAEKLYRAAAYDSTLEVFLWLVIILSATGSLVLFNRVAPLWISFIAIVLLLWLAFAWLPKAKVSRVTNRFTVMVTPVVATILNYLHPVVKHFYRWSKTNLGELKHTGVYDKKDLIDLIEQQKKQPDSRIPKTELEIMLRSVALSEIKTSDVCLPWSKVKTVTAQDSLGPILLDELHKSEQSFIPVTEEKGSKVLVGVLNLTKIDINIKGLVSESMDSPVYYLNEDDSLDVALQSFAVTNYPLFIVVDNKQRYVGMLPFSKVIEKLVGHIPGEDFDNFASISEAANKHT